MLQIQIIPHTGSDIFRVVVFVKDAKGNNIDAYVSLIARLGSGNEAVFMMAPRARKISTVYPEGGSKFLHRIEKGVYVAQSKNKRLANVREIVVMARVGKERVEKTMRIAGN